MRDLKAKPKKIQVFIVDDHPIVRHGLSQLINEEPDMHVCGDAATTDEAMRLLKNIKPDIAIVDLSLEGQSGIELIKSVKLKMPHIPTLVLSMHDENLYAERALRAGSKGYVMKQEAPEKVVEAIRHVLAGKIYLNEDIATKLITNAIGGKGKNQYPLQRLSDRELEVFRLIGMGHPTRQIADQLCVSIKTIETYREHIKEKLDLHNATELIQHAVSWNKSDSL